VLPWPDLPWHILLRPAAPNSHQLLPHRIRCRPKGLALYQSKSLLAATIIATLRPEGAATRPISQQTGHALIVSFSYTIVYLFVRRVWPFWHSNYVYRA